MCVTRAVRRPDPPAAVCAKDPAHHPLPTWLREPRSSRAGASSARRSITSSSKIVPLPQNFSRARSPLAIKGLEPCQQLLTCAAELQRAINHDPSV
jgi:hypothetical protein